MKLRTKVSVIILFIWAAMAIIFYLGSQRIILNSYARVEDRMVNDNLDRTVHTLQQMIETVELNAKEWSALEETNQLISKNNKSNISKKLTFDSLKEINIDSIIFYNKENYSVYSQSINDDKTKLISAPSELLKAIRKIIDDTVADTGLIATNSDIYLVAIEPVLSATDSNVHLGKIVLAKRLTEAVVTKLFNIAKVEASLFRVASKTTQENMSQIYNDLIGNNHIVTERTDNTLYGYRFLQDISDNPIVILQVRQKRDIYAIGIETIKYANVVVLIFSFAIIVLLWMLLQYLIVKRIENLNKNIIKMGTDKKIFGNLIENMTDEVSSVAELYHKATHDPLTGLANRNLLYQAFDTFAEQLSDPDHKIAVIFIDLDHFKRINDTLGHEVGDHILKRIADRLKRTLREDDIAARMGGDEFVVMLNNIHKNNIDDAADRVFTLINMPIQHDQHNIYITASMGICVYPDDGLTIDTIVKLADIALYHVKEHGRNQFQFYSDALSKTLTETHRQEIELQKAIDNNELCVYYQPIYDVKTKSIISFEALVRWNHPTSGLLSADSIIPIAERTALIHPIGEWLLKTVCKQINKWLVMGLPAVPVAVNFSSSQLHESSIFKRINTILDATGLDPCYLQIEITETGFIELTPQLLKELQKLQNKGITLSIDDFGTGYSSLGYLKKLPVKKLKIDKSFIRDIETDPDDKAIVLAIIAIAHQLDLRVVAEGVETIAQYTFISENEVDEAQGIFLGSPMSKEDSAKLLKNAKPKK